MSVDLLTAIRPARVAWSRGSTVGRKRPHLPRNVWSITLRLKMVDNARDPALFNMAIDSKLRCCDLVALGVCNVLAAAGANERALMVKSKSVRPTRV